MGYEIYFDESNKLDQNRSQYSYYGALGISQEIAGKVSVKLDDLLGSEYELHFSQYTSDTYFERYLLSLYYILIQDIRIHIFVVNNNHAHVMGNRMGIDATKVRQMFYVKIPERLFYGIVRKLPVRENIKIILDENLEYEHPDICLAPNIEKQMNAQSIYRKLGYCITSVQMCDSKESRLLQLIDVIMGMIVYLIEKNYMRMENTENSVVAKVKNDLIYRLLLEEKVVQGLQTKVKMYEWSLDSPDQISQLNIGDHLSHFVMEKTKFDIKEMQKLQALQLHYPELTTKEYRLAMKYTNREFIALKGYMDQLEGKHRNDFYKPKILSL
ncbi:hypothetical protein B9G55_02400 [Saccharibacillus sp. O16]|nr:hypothetical protein B9G55_02400 [Saccharibacillus sp. O16]